MGQNIESNDVGQFYFFPKLKATYNIVKSLVISNFVFKVWAYSMSVAIQPIFNQFSTNFQPNLKKFLINFDILNFKAISEQFQSSFRAN